MWVPTRKNYENAYSRTFQIDALEFYYRFMSSSGPILHGSGPTVIINRATTLHRAGLKKSTMYVLIKNGLFPHQVQKTEGTVGWDEAEVEGWIRARKALRPGSSAEKGAEATAKSPARSISPSVNVLAWPEGAAAAGQLQSLNAEQITQLIGRGSPRPKASNPNTSYDPRRERCG